MVGRIQSRQLGQAAAVASLALLLSSCGGGDGPVLHPVRGTVLYEDKPAEGATVVFHPVNGTPDSPRPSGVVGKDGTFTLRTHPHGEGAPEGNYVVLVTWFEAAGPAKKEGRDPPDPKSKLSEHYTDAAKSGLKATVKPGENKLEPFKLTRKGSPAAAGP
jgi:hypothetical protein